MQKRPLRAILDIRRTELPFALLMFAYFFLVVASFWILKPIKKSLFIEHYDESGLDLLGWTLKAAEAELLAKVLNMLVAFAAVVVFTWLSRRFWRQQLTFIFTALFVAGYVLFAFALERDGGTVVWSFYLYGDLFSTLMVATFFAFLNDSVTAEAAKRMYGLVGLGGVLGGAVGSSVLSVFIEEIAPSSWLWICVALALVIAVVAAAAGRLAPAPSSAGPAPPAPKPHGAGPKPQANSNAAIEGARLVARSPYLLAIVAIVGLYEVVSTLMDFQFSSAVSHYLEDTEIRSHFSLVFAITNILAMVVQLFLTSPIMMHFGVGVALLVLPLAAFTGSTAFLLFPSLWTGSLLNTADNAFSYSINQSAKETLYVPTTRDEKYRAKAFVDMFLMRSAKAAAVVVSLGIAAVFRDFSSIRWLSLLTLALLGLWVWAATYAGRRFRELESH